MKYKVVYEHDANGWWVASIPRVAGCHTQGRTLAHARERIREALEVALELPEAEAAKTARSAVFVEDVRLPAATKRKLVASRAARERAAAVETKAQEATRAAVRALVGAAGLSLRDAAELLGLSHQRVQQLATGG